MGSSLRGILPRNAADKARSDESDALNLTYHTLIIIHQINLTQICPSQIKLSSSRRFRSANYYQNISYVQNTGAIYILFTCISFTSTPCKIHHIYYAFDAFKFQRVINKLFIAKLKFIYDIKFNASTYRA